MWSAIWNWIKNLFFSCFPSMRPDASWREVDPLLVPDDQVIAEEPASPPDNDPQQEISSNVLISRELNKPVMLTPEESALTIYYAQRGENEYIDQFTIEKQKKAFELIKCIVHNNINQINIFFGRLLQLNKEANRLEASWRRARTDFHEGSYSEYNIIPVCSDFREKQIGPNANHSTLQKSLLTLIINKFELCKTMLRLNVFRRAYLKGQRCPTPTKIDVQTEILRTETKMNAKTLTLVNNFNQRCENYAKENPPKENPPTERRGRRSKMYGYNN